MEPKSMVHALEQIHEMLEAGGHLIDIHPNGELDEFIYPLDGSDQFLGYMQETNDYIEYRQADEALQVALSKGLFRIVKTGEFEFRTYADSFDELKAFLDENWSDAVVTDEVLTNAKKLEREHGRRKVYLRERTKLNLLIAS
jgi:hypothetical protein